MLLTETKEDILLRMQEDLKRALSKPQEKRKWTMVIDLRKCVGCYACTIACKAENVLPPGVVYRRVLDIESGKYPDVKRDFVPVLCNHCEKAPCVNACPVKATTIREDGIVDIDYNECIPEKCVKNAFFKFISDDKRSLKFLNSLQIFEYFTFVSFC